jgi:hypothetical protein
MHFIVDDVSYLPKIDRINDFIISIGLIAIKIFGLSTMA